MLSTQVPHLAHQSQATLHSSSSPHTGRSDSAAEDPDRDICLPQVELEPRGKWFGPMSLTESFDKCLPVPPVLPRRPNSQRVNWGKFRSEDRKPTELLERLKNVPHVVAHGNADQQKTVSKSSFRNLFQPGKLSLPFHICFQEVGRRLTEFRTTYELITAIKDAIKAHQVAYDEARILHRDISPGNVLISEDGKSGFLIDWDFSKPVVDPETPRQHVRTGTWQFMSAQLLLGNATPHERADDLESFFHVLCWVLLKYGPHTLTPTTVVELLDQDYNYAVIYEGRMTGGTNKMRALMSRNHRGQHAGLPAGCLKNLIVDFEDLVAVRYDNHPSPEDREQYDDLAALANYDDKRLNRHAVWKYYESLERLEDWNWVYERFCKATQDPSQLSDARVDRTQELADADVNYMVRGYWH